MIVVAGVTEERAAEIAEYKMRQVLGEFSAAGREIAHARVTSFDHALIAEFASKGILSVFADPGFLILLNRAQLQAAASKSETDEQLLIKLLRERARRDEKTMQLAIAGAIEVIDKIDDGALLGLTILWFIAATLSSSLDPLEGLHSREDVFKKLLAEKSLPPGPSWLYRLDLLGLVSASNSGLQSMRSMDEIIFAPTPGFICRGIEENEAVNISDRLENIHSGWGELVVPHAFCDGNYRLKVARQSDIDTLAVDAPLSPDQLQSFWSIINEAGSFQPDEKVRQTALDYVWANLPSTTAIRDWWNQVNRTCSIRITLCGHAVAYSNLKLFDDLEGMPELVELFDS
jgi:hypothetical protein